LHETSLKYFTGAPPLRPCPSPDGHVQERDEDNEQADLPEYPGHPLSYIIQLGDHYLSSFAASRAGMVLTVV